MFKNLTVRQLAILLTFIILVSNSLIIFALSFYIELLENDAFKIISLLVIFVLNYFLIKSLLEAFVFRKIKLIYKLIRGNKMTQEEKLNKDLTGQSLNDVNNEVEQWANETLQEIETLKLLENYRKDYVGNVSHELKTPIFSIQGYLHTLIDGGIYDEKVNKNYLQRAINNADRLQKIVEDLEIISKFEGGGYKPEFSKWDLKSLVQEVIEDLQALANDKNIRVGFKEGAAPRYFVFADREMIRRVLINLMVNAIKYGKEKGEVKVSFYEVDKEVLTEITDDGMGIDEKHLKHVFDRFYRIDTSRARAVGGSGLGLSIVKHAIEAHNQKLNLRSKEGYGSTFGFTLKKA